MKQVVKSIVVVGAMLAAGAVAADMDFNPFIGVDYLQAWTPGKGNISNTNVNAKNAFQKSFPGATVYVGTKFNEFFGIELGADWSGNKKRTVSGTVTNAAATSFTYSVKTRRSGFHGDLIGFLPMDCWELFGSVGYGSVKIKLSEQAVTSTPTTAAFNNQFPLSAKKKGVLRLGIGAGYMFTDMIGGRVKLGWEGTESLRLKYNAASGIADSKAFKNSTTLAAGLFVRW